MGQYVALLRQADALRQRYPGFDLPELCADRRFTALLGAGADMEQAYLSLHQQEVLRAAVTHTAEIVSQKLAAGLGSTAGAPAGGRHAGGQYRRAPQNPGDLSRAQRKPLPGACSRGKRSSSEGRGNKRGNEGAQPENGGRNQKENRRSNAGALPNPLAGCFMKKRGKAAVPAIAARAGYIAKNRPERKGA